MRIGNYELQTPVFLAPMAGITDKAFREITLLTGGKYCVTEMISAKALIYENSKTLRMLDLTGEPEPRIVQLFGSEPEVMAEAGKRVVQKGANIIDINMGCPTPKIVRNGEGAALLKNLPLAVQIAEAVCRAVEVPVTVKMRIGWDKSELVAEELALRLEAVGVSMVTVHARTREQYYAGKADWEWIKRIKQKVSIPVIGNGDIATPSDALHMLKETGCDGVMIGRGALGNPWLIGRTQHLLETGNLPPEPNDQQKLSILLLHFQKLVTYKGEKTALNEIRKHAAWYIRGQRKAAEYRNQIMSCKSIEEMKRIFYKAFVSKSS